MRRWGGQLSKKIYNDSGGVEGMRDEMYRWRRQ